MLRQSRFILSNFLFVHRERERERESIRRFKLSSNGSIVNKSFRKGYSFSGAKKKRMKDRR